MSSTYSEPNICQAIRLNMDEYPLKVSIPTYHIRVCYLKF